MEGILSKVIGKRKECRITQSEMAFKLGISPVAYNKKETGKTEFTLREFVKITKITKTHPSYFFEDIVEKNESLKD